MEHPKLINALEKDNNSNFLEERDVSLELQKLEQEMSALAWQSLDVHLEKVKNVSDNEDFRRGLNAMIYRDFKKLLNKLKVYVLAFGLSAGLVNYIDLKTGELNEDFTYSSFGEDSDIVKNERLGAYKKEFSEYFARNIIPVGYDVSGKEPGEQSASDLFSKTMAIDLTKKENLKDRYDAWCFYLGLPQEYGTLAVSEYRPSMSKDSNTVYYSLPRKEAYLLNYGLSILDANQVDKMVVLDRGTNTVAEENYDLSSYMDSVENKEKFHRIKDSLDIESLFPEGDYGVMGQYTISKGVDEKGCYISYYDKWDLTPFQDVGVKKEASEILSVGKPFEIYGRIYYDPKTGKRID